MSLRKEFVLKALSKEAPIAELCRAFGISRKTAYKWIDRFKKHGFDVTGGATYGACADLRPRVSPAS